MQIIFTEEFPTFCYPFEVYKCTKKLVDESMNLKSEFMILKSAYHFDICDAILFNHMEFYL
jgi:hypothetical protein